MLRTTLFAPLLAAVTTAFAQTGGSYQPAVPSASSFSAYGASPGYNSGGGGTVEGSTMRGMASVISAKGDYNLSTSAAAVNLTQAQKQEIQNRQQATHAYFEMQETNRAAVSAKRSPRLSQEQLVRLAGEAAPKPIDSTEVNPVSGKVSWPDLLQDAQFAQERVLVEQLLVKQAHYGHLGFSDQNQAGQAIDSMSGKLHSQISNVPAQQYVASKNFLKSLMYSITKSQLG